MDRETAPDL
uniref:Uncharacterized protein n=1 Tax=Anguilla anguilla TaxID=7936 RepID=A0A0E9RCE6_ANGAN